MRRLKERVLIDAWAGDVDLTTGFRRVSAFIEVVLPDSVQPSLLANPFLPTFSLFPTANTNVSRRVSNGRSRYYYHHGTPTCCRREIRSGITDSYDTEYQQYGTRRSRHSCVTRDTNTVARFSLQATRNSCNCDIAPLYIIICVQVLRSADHNLALSLIYWSYPLPLCCVTEVGDFVLISLQALACPL